MDSRPDRAAVPARKEYRKPELVRVDLLEDEVALAACKSPNPTSLAGASGLFGNKKCKTSCRGVRTS
jgi:hypothetical protein